MGQNFNLIQFQDFQQKSLYVNIRPKNQDVIFDNK